MNKQSTTVADTNTTDKAAPLFEEEIDEFVVAQANIDEAWGEPIYVQHLKHDSPLTGEHDVARGEKV